MDFEADGDEDKPEEDVDEIDDEEQEHCRAEDDDKYGPYACFDPSGTPSLIQTEQKIYDNLFVCYMEYIKKKFFLQSML